MKYKSKRMEIHYQKRVQIKHGLNTQGNAYIYAFIRKKSAVYTYIQCIRSFQQAIQETEKIFGVLYFLISYMQLQIHNYPAP